jgi:hypothetical protein
LEEQAREAIAIASRIDSAAREAPSNRWPVNQAALGLKAAKGSPDGSISYLAQLAWWGLEKGGLEIPRPIAPNQPEPHDLELALGALLGSGPESAADASEWFLSNPNLDRKEQEGNLESPPAPASACRNALKSSDATSNSSRPMLGPDNLLAPQ